MLELAYALAPFTAFTLFVNLLALVRHRERRESIARRRSDLRTPPADREDVIDLSRNAAARASGARVGGAVNYAGFVLIAASVVLDPPVPVVLGMLAGAIWLLTHWPQAANLTMALRTRTVSIAYAQGTWRYAFPRYRASATSGYVPIAIAVFANLYLLAAGLPLANHNDTLATGIPGLAFENTGLGALQLAVLLVGAGAALSVLSIRVDRALRRREMRRTSGLTPCPTDGDPSAVYLRPFDAEELRIRSRLSGRRDRLSILLPQGWEYLEDVSTWLVWSQAPVVAIANPGARRAKTLGASHHLVGGDGDWQQVATDLIEQAPLILIIPGDSAGVTWELDLVLGTPRYAAKALCINPRGRESAGSFLDYVGASAAARMHLRDRDLVPIGAIPGNERPTLLCSGAMEDVDVEASVEWFLRQRTSLGARIREAVPELADH